MTPPPSYDEGTSPAKLGRKMILAYPMRATHHALLRLTCGQAQVCALPLWEDDRLAIDYEKRDGVAYITLNNPAKANIFDKPTADAISEAWIDLWEDRSIRCAILTGKGDTHFCGGHNLAPRENITEEEREYLRTQRIFWPLAGTVNGQKTGVDGRIRGCGNR